MNFLAGWFFGVFLVLSALYISRIRARSRGVVIVYGDAFADDSPRNRQAAAQRLVAKATGSAP